MTAARPRHRAVLADAPLDLGDRRPEPGSIAILPEYDEFFASSVAAAGGVVAPLGPDTRGIVWLSSTGAEQLEAVLAAHPRIGWVQLPWAGVDAFADTLRGSDRPGLVWTSAKGSYAQPVAEHALMLTLALLRVIPLRLETRSWTHREEGRSLYGANVVIVGAGGIALELVRLLEPFGADITIVRRRPQPVEGVHTVTGEELAGLLPGADVVILAAAATAQTARLIGARELDLLPAHALLVNIARGSLVDTDALVAALTAGSIGGAGIDVTDPEPLPDGHPLWTSPNTIVTPHSADTPSMTAPLLAERIESNVRAFLRGGAFTGIVDVGAGY